ncbi:MAG: hypothetical protein ACKVLI_01895 [Alphaproteobacteria bacterium]|jgi:hypothetical protein
MKNKFNRLSILFILFFLVGCESVSDLSMPNLGMPDLSKYKLNPFSEDKTSSISCPSAMILADAVSLNEFISYDSPNESDLIYKARIETITYDCSYQDLQIKGNLYISGSIALGPQGSSGEMDLPIFIALVKNDNDVTNRRFVNIKTDIPQGATLLRFDHVFKDFEFYIDSTKDIASYEILTGFNLNSRQLNYNRVQ